jgi:transcription elongation GreA/GreB family factor
LVGYPDSDVRTRSRQSGSTLRNSYLFSVSRAFVNEDSLVGGVPDRPIPPGPNYVTKAGLAQTDAELAAAHRAHGEAQASGDREALAKAARDVRYWNARRVSAQLVVPDPTAGRVQFGSTVTFVRDDGREQTFRIVGEDEANPSTGTISHVSPLAKALLGKGLREVVRAGAEDAEIVEIR